MTQSSSASAVRRRTALRRRMAARVRRRFFALPPGRAAKVRFGGAVAAIVLCAAGPLAAAGIWLCALAARSLALRPGRTAGLSCPALAVGAAGRLLREPDAVVPVVLEAPIPAGEVQRLFLIALRPGAALRGGGSPVLCPVVGSVGAVLGLRPAGPGTALRPGTAVISVLGHGAALPPFRLLFYHKRAVESITGF